MKKILFALCVLACFGCSTVSEVSSLNKNFLVPPVQYESKKDIMIFFTGSDWDADSQKAAANLFTDEFYKKYSSQFKIYSVDITRSKLDKDPKAMELAYTYFAEYEITDYPMIALETTEGYVYALENIKFYCNSLETFDAFLQTQMPKRERINELAKKVKTTTGPDHTKAIDAFLETVELPYSHRHDALVISAYESDPANESGLYKKYLIAYTELKANSFMNKGDALSAAEEFLAIAENEVFGTNEKQANYYTAAFYLASTNEHLETVLEYLQKALNISPLSELADQIKNAIKAVNQRLAAE